MVDKWGWAARGSGWQRSSILICVEEDSFLKHRRTTRARLLGRTARVHTLRRGEAHSQQERWMTPTLLAPRNRPNGTRNDDDDTAMLITHRKHL